MPGLILEINVVWVNCTKKMILNLKDENGE
jgi:hypothetical protein